MKKIVKKIKEICEYQDRTSDSVFFKNSLEELLEKKKSVFFRQTELFGEICEQSYTSCEILIHVYQQNVFRNIVNFEQEANELNFKRLLDSYYLLNLSLIEANKTNERPHGYFLPDYIFCSLLSYCFYPQSLPYMLTSLKKYHNEKFINQRNQIRNENIEKYYGYSNIFQLLKFILKEKYPSVFEDVFSVNISCEYKYIIDNLLSEDINTISDILEKLAILHMKNPGNSYLDVYNHIEWRYLPLEIITVYKFREYNGISNVGIKNKLTKKIIPFILSSNNLPEMNNVKEIEKCILNHESI